MIFYYSWPQITTSTLLSIIFFFNKMVISQDLDFHLFFFFSCFNRRLGVAYGCHRLCAACGCRRLSVSFLCRCHDATFICVRVIRTSNVYPISDKKSN